MSGPWFVDSSTVAYMRDAVSDAVKYLVDPEGAEAADDEASAVAPMATKGIKAAAMAFEAAVGMDEPPSEMS